MLKALLVLDAQAGLQLGLLDFVHRDQAPEATNCLIQVGGEVALLPTTNTQQLRVAHEDQSHPQQKSHVKTQQLCPKRQTSFQVSHRLLVILPDPELTQQQPPLCALLQVPSHFIRNSSASLFQIITYSLPVLSSHQGLPLQGLLLPYPFQDLRPLPVYPTLLWSTLYRLQVFPVLNSCCFIQHKFHNKTHVLFLFPNMPRFFTNRQVYLENNFIHWSDDSG